MTFEKPKAVAEFTGYVIRQGVMRALGRIAAAGDAALDCWDGQTEDSRMFNKWLGEGETPAATEEELMMGEGNV